MQPRNELDNLDLGHVVAGGLKPSGEEVPTPPGKKRVPGKKGDVFMDDKPATTPGS